MDSNLKSELFKLNLSKDKVKTKKKKGKKSSRNKIFVPDNDAKNVARRCAHCQPEIFRTAVSRQKGEAQPWGQAKS